MFRIVRQSPCKLSHIGPGRDEFRILNRVDSLGETDHEAIEFLREFRNVFLGRPDGWLAFKHRAGVIGRSMRKLERDEINRSESNGRSIAQGAWFVVHGDL